MRELNATITVQRYWRGYAARSAYQKAHRIILKLQVGCERFEELQRSALAPCGHPQPSEAIQP